MSLVLLTGISGFIGSHIANELLKSGYRVRGTVRSFKVNDIQERYKEHGDKVEIVGVDDLIAGSFKEALEGVDAVIHAASPLPGRESAESTLKSAEEGAVNVLRQAQAAGIKNFVQLSSITSAYYPNFTSLTDKDWNPTTREQATAPGVSPLRTYAASKAFAERAVWEFAEKHPEIEVAAINPAFNYGPFAPTYKIENAKISAASTNVGLWSLWYSQLTIPFASEFVDVRDVARVCVAALRAPPTSEVGRKRFLLAAKPWAGTKDIYEYVSEKRPELAGRFTEAAKEGKPAPPHYVDISRALDLLKVELTPWQDTVLEAFDTLVAYEKEWKAQGLTPN